MDVFYVLATVLVSVGAPFAVVVNIVIVYFILRHKQLRRLSVAGLIILCAANDVVFDIQISFKAFEVARTLRNVSTTYQLCSVQKIGNFYTITAGKASLLALTIDRVMAVYAPMRYRIRNHSRFAITAAALVVGFSASWLAYAASVTRWTGTTMTMPCTSASLFPSTAITRMIGASVLVDLLVYVANALLIYKISRGSRVAPKRSTALGGPSAKTEEAMTRREAAITRSVRGAVLVHLLFGTLPFVCLGMATVAMKNGVLSKQSASDAGAVYIMCNMGESVFNSYVYVSRLPHFKNILLGKKSASATAKLA